MPHTKTCVFCARTFEHINPRAKHCSKECRQKNLNRQARETRKVDPSRYRKACAKYEKTEKGKKARKRNVFVKSMAARYKRYVKRDMRKGIEFPEAMKAAKRLIYTEYAALGVEAKRAEEVVGKEYDRIISNYENRVLGNG